MMARKVVVPDESEGGFTKMQQLRFNMIYDLERKDRSVALGLSILAGNIGLDRFYLGDITLGIVKFLTFGTFIVSLALNWTLHVNNGWLLLCGIGVELPPLLLQCVKIHCLFAFGACLALVQLDWFRIRARTDEYNELLLGQIAVSLKSQRGRVASPT